MSHRDAVAPRARRLRGDGRDRRRRRWRPWRARERRHVRRPVPPRGGPHALRHRPAQVVPVRRLRLRAHVDGDPRHRGAGRAGAGPGRRRARDLRPLGRRRQRRGGADRAQGDRRPAHLRLRRPRPDAPERGRAGGGRPSARHFGVPLVHVRAQEHFIARARGHHRARGEAQDDRPRVHPHLRARGRRSSRTPASWCRGRSTPTSSSRARATPPRSRATTTWAACPTTWWSSWSSRCASSSRTRCGWWARSSASPRTWSGASPSRGPGLAIRIIGEVTQERLDILRQADFVLQEEVRRAGLYRDLWQSFAVLPGDQERRRAGRRAHLRLSRS